MQVNIIHVVSNLNRINTGVWGAALFASSYLDSQHGFRSVMWVCSDQSENEIEAEAIPIFFIGKTNTMRSIAARLKSQNLNIQSTIAVTHGSWLAPTHVGFKLRSIGLRWIYTPQGMLEPWSLQQKKWKKLFYFHLIEKRKVHQATLLRAVSVSEKRNLEHVFKREVRLIENGVNVPVFKRKPDGDSIFLFLARLHHKKGIVHVMQSWSKSMHNAVHCKLIIAGPDEGELQKIRPYFGANVEYIGPVYGDQKKLLLERSHYYILPSYSEGFPSSVIEAMSYGLIPIISEGCNFPQVFEKELGYKISTNEESISEVLIGLKKSNFDHELSFRNHKYIDENNSVEAIGEKLFSMYSGLIES